MKKILLVAAIGVILLLSGIQAVALPSNVKTNNGNTQGARSFTHTVFSEFFSTTSCPHCPYCHLALKNIYYGGWYPFYYTSMCYGHNTHANARANDYNVYYVPDTFFDGGYQVYCGSVNDNIQQTMSQFNTSITQCGSRAAPDIQTILNVNWLGNATMDIQASVQNNDTVPYNGHIRVYVCEVESSMGWKDAQNHLYTFPFLEYAFNEDISIGPSSTWSDEITWDGHNYNDGYGHNFGSIQYGNIAIIATVFNATSYTAYSDAPYSYNYPFNAYNVDDATGFLVGGTGPNPPSNPDPKNGAVGVDIHKQLSWTGGGSPGSTITYDVYFGTTNPPTLIVHNQSATTYNPGTMNYLTNYYWKIVAWDQDDNTMQGPIWSFTTLQNPNQPPTPPTITGPAKGKPNAQYKFTFTTTDPDTPDSVYVLVDWGDNTTTDWVGPHTSGSPFIITHSWTTKGTFTVKAKAKDDHGAESDWATLTVKMPATYGMTNPFIHWLLERFPNAFPLLRHLFGE
jgi:hypothetical protein